jgi:hypothetical protein
MWFCHGAYSGLSIVMMMVVMMVVVVVVVMCMCSFSPAHEELHGA